MTEKAISALEELGFSTYEARAYLALLQESPVTGYRLSKRSGIPRSRVYETLERLVVKGYAMVLQAASDGQEGPVEYAPLAAKELMAQLEEQFDDTLSALETEIESIETAIQPESIWNLQGQGSILDRARMMIERAQESIYLVGWADIIRQVRSELASAAERSVRIVVISCGEIDLAVGVHYSHAFEEHIVCQDDSSINLEIDGMEVLVGETLPADGCRAAWSRNAGLVHVTEEYIRHEVYVHKIIKRLGESAAAELREAFAAGLQEVPHTIE